MRLMGTVVLTAALLALAPAPAAAASRGECEDALKHLNQLEAEDKVRRSFAKFAQQKKLAEEARKKEDWNTCYAAAAEALKPGRPARPPAARP
ncbi:MAG TPA: hypothetical protein VGT02_12785 [Methylomirabilota bacterium]|jgi:hypothetical protein|nr:hypothetical protein [Methylomirabilota bacterium]